MLFSWCVLIAMVLGAEIEMHDMDMWMYKCM
jgi:hypothetical protein